MYSQTFHGSLEDSLNTFNIYLATTVKKGIGEIFLPNYIQSPSLGS
jgi:hypothetical protein